jgi:hypothetical protein
MKTDRKSLLHSKSRCSSCHRFAIDRSRPIVRARSEGASSSWVSVSSDVPHLCVLVVGPLPPSTGSRPLRSTRAPARPCTSRKCACGGAAAVPMPRWPSGGPLAQRVQCRQWSTRSRRVRRSLERELLERREETAGGEEGRRSLQSAWLSQSLGQGRGHQGCSGGRGLNAMTMLSQ